MRRFGWDVGDGRRSDSEGGDQGAAGSSGAIEPSPNGSTRDCVVLKRERARAEQSEQHWRRGAWRRGTERVLVPADSNRGDYDHSTYRGIVLIIPGQWKF